MKIFSISEINRTIRSLLEEGFSDIWIEAEISNFRPASSGHFYFSLKDAQSQMKAVMFRGSQRDLRFSLENGLSVLCHGKITVYEPRGEYQIIVDHMEPKGAGALQLAFEQLKKKLTEEGLFAAERKRPLPFLPQKIGIVTSPTGAVIRDMIHVLTRRFPNIQILLCPVLVQGEGAAAQIASAIEELNQRDDLDLLIVGRGGGSMEDLWSFNEEIVVRAIFASRLPVISAVGHETDFTLADFVADLRAPTPSAAAELAVPVLADLLRAIEDFRFRLHQSIQERLEKARLELRQWEGYFRDPGRRLTEGLLKLDHLRSQMETTMLYRLQTEKEALVSWRHRLESLNPMAVLDRGYALATREGDHRPLREASEVSPGETVQVHLARGGLLTEVRKRID